MKPPRLIHPAIWLAKIPQYPVDMTNDLVVNQQKYVKKKGDEPILGFVVVLDILFPNQTKNQYVSSISRDLRMLLGQNSHLCRVLG